MKSESDPITEDEFLLRRVRFDRFRTDQIPIISPNAFEPRITGRDPDTDGISLYREACLNDPLDILATIPPEKHNEYAIVSIPVAILASLQLTVEARPVGDLPGHVVIPELNSAAYKADKASFTNIKLELAKVASLDENILRRPDL